MLVKVGFIDKLLCLSIDSATFFFFLLMKINREYENPNIQEKKII